MLYNNCLELSNILPKTQKINGNDIKLMIMIADFFKKI